MKKTCAVAVAIGLISTSGCGEENTSSNVESPGSAKSATTKALNTGADVLQDKTPLKKFDVYLDGFHFYNGNMDAQMEAHHYVNQLNEDLYQAVIFDGNGADAKLMGIEYIVSEKLFRSLPQEEKKLWHSHAYEVRSGTLIAPGLPEAAEHTLMTKLVSTYGKTIHTWHTDQKETLPLGSPMLMMGMTKDGQIHPGLVTERDRRFSISTAEIKENRRDIAATLPDPAANAWEKGEVRQFTIADKADSALKKHQTRPAK